MHTKTMEGLVGASTNMKLLDTPFRVYKEARRRGDTEAMKRATGYVEECSDQAEEYKAKAEKGMKEDAEEARRRAKAECENAVRKRKEEREELEKRTEKLEKKAEEGRREESDSVEISEQGKAACNRNADPAAAVRNDGASAEETAGKAADVVKAEPVIYTRTGKGLPGKAPSYSFDVRTPE